MSILSRPPSGSLVTFWPSRKSLAPQGETPLRQRKLFYHRPLIRPLRGHLSLSPLSLCDIIPTPFGLRPFLPDRGNRPLDKGSRPPGGRLTGGHMGPPLRVERTDAIMCVGAGHWPARKRAADSRPYGGKWTRGLPWGPEKKSGAPVKNTGAPGQKQVKHIPPCCRFRPSGR